MEVPRSSRDDVNDPVNSLPAISSLMTTVKNPATRKNTKITKPATAWSGDRVVFTLRPAEFNALAALLEKPPAPSDALRRLMAKKAPWEN